MLSRKERERSKEERTFLRRAGGRGGGSAPRRPRSKFRRRLRRNVRGGLAARARAGDPGRTPRCIDMGPDAGPGRPSRSRGDNMYRDPSRVAITPPSGRQACRVALPAPLLPHPSQVTSESGHIRVMSHPSQITSELGHIRVRSHSSQPLGPVPGRNAAPTPLPTPRRRRSLHSERAPPGIRSANPAPPPPAGARPASRGALPRAGRLRRH